jgi:hypothetical protein
MPGAMSGVLGKIMGPLMMAVGAGAAPFTGGATLPLAMGGLQQTMSPGGLLGTTPASGAPTIKAPALTSAPVGPPAAPDIPTPAGSGLSLSVPGAQPSGTSGAGTSGDITNLIAQAMGTGGGSPFAAFGS